jgi:hypothetical protein
MVQQISLGLVWTMLTVIKVAVAFLSPDHYVRLMLPTVVVSMAQYLPNSINLSLAAVLLFFTVYITWICQQHVKTMHMVWRHGGPMWVLNELRPYAGYSVEPSVSFVILYLILAAELWTLEATLKDFASSHR